VILREETTDGWSRVTDEDERVARVGWSVITAPHVTDERIHCTVYNNNNNNSGQCL